MVSVRLLVVGRADGTGSGLLRRWLDDWQLHVDVVHDGVSATRAPLRSAPAQSYRLLSWTGEAPGARRGLPMAHERERRRRTPASSPARARPWRVTRLQGVRGAPSQASHQGRPAPRDSTSARASLSARRHGACRAARSPLSQRVRAAGARVRGRPGQRHPHRGAGAAARASRSRRGQRQRRPQQPGRRATISCFWISTCRGSTASRSSGRFALVSSFAAGTCRWSP